MIRARVAARVWVAACVAVLVVAVTGGDAWAQVPAVTGIVGSVLRLESDGTSADSYSTGHPHPGGVPANVINYSDCEADLRFGFTLSLSGDYTPYNLVAWAGPDDCTAAAARTSGTATCWPVTPGAIVPTGATDDAGAPIVQVVLRMQDIVSQAGTGTAPNPAYPAATSAACSVQQSDSASSLAVYFFFTDQVGVGDAVGFAQAYPIVADTVAQDVGSDGFSVSQSTDAELTVAVSAAADSDTLVFNIYCDPPPGQESTVSQVPVDAATNNGVCPADSVSAGTTSGTPTVDASDDASDDGATTSDAATSDAAGTSTSDSGGAPSTSIDDAGGNPCGARLNDAGVPSASVGGCAESILKSGGGTTVPRLVPALDDAGNDLTLPDGAVVYEDGGTTTTGGTMTLGIPSKYLCGTVSPSNATLNVTGLKDGYYYTIAVAAVDSAGNVGPLAVACQEPVQLADFWYRYTSAGGQAGGGYCAAAENVGAPAGMSGLGVLGAACVVALVRRRRRRD
jgi:hypothetical protein